MFNPTVVDATQLRNIVSDSAPYYIVFDTSLYNYSEVLNLAHAYSALPHNGSSYVGTLYPERQMILTNLHIFTL